MFVGIVLLLLTLGVSMAWFNWFSRSKNGKGNTPTSQVAFFWEQHPSIYEHIKAHSTPDGKGLTEEGETLPDEAKFTTGSGLRWAAGAQDGVFGHHMAQGEVQSRVAPILGVIRTFCEAPTAINKHKVHEALGHESLLPLTDPLLEALGKASDIPHNRLYELAKSLATESPDREPVKLGIAILGLFRERQDRQAFLTLGRHEEFTLYCAVALANGPDVSTAENDLWELAQSVHGWGRIHTVERLSRTQNPRIKDWLIREGFKNSVMDEYLAYLCADKGGLRAALEHEPVDNGLIESAGRIITALLSGGPAQDINDYDDGAVVVEAYLKQLSPRASKIKEFLIVSVVQSWLADEKADWKTRAAKGWSDQRRAALREQAKDILARPIWRQAVLKGLGSENDIDFDEASRAADGLAIETWPYHWARLEKKPLEAGRWFPIMRQCNKDRIEAVVAMAERSLPLDGIATGAGTEMGLGKGFGPHSCLDFILQDLGPYPGHGYLLIQTGLRSPVIRNRNMALKALAEWGKGQWPAGAEQTLQQALSQEPDPKVKALIQKVLAGKTWEEIGRAEM
jgi:hypothetical protein